MRQWVVASLRAGWFALSALTAASGCSFDRGAIPPSHQQPSHPDASDGDSGRDARASDLDDARVPPHRDAEPEASMPPGADAETDAASEPNDAATDAAMDATVDAGPDAAIDAGDAATDDDAGGEPDAADPCGDPKPCVCPHEAIDENDECPLPPVCALDECAPDEDCRFGSYGSARYYFCDDERSWEQASDRCEAITGAHLVILQSAGEDAYVLTQISDKTWLGGSDGEYEGLWLWPDGTAFYDEVDETPVAGRFNNWDDGEPNNTGLSMSAADCLMYWYENDAWADASCGDEHPYVCEID